MRRLGIWSFFLGWEVAGWRLSEAVGQPAYIPVNAKTWHKTLTAISRCIHLDVPREHGPYRRIVKLLVLDRDFPSHVTLV